MFRHLIPSLINHGRILGFLTVLLPALCHGEVVRVEVLERSDLGDTGYEQIIGRLHFQIDPQLPVNTVIADISLAPVNESGQVSFSSDLRILKPKSTTAANGAAWIEIPNRGGKSKLSPWMIDQGFTLVNIGWEFDAPKTKEKLNIEVPRTVNKDGSPIRGIVSTTFITNKPTEEYTLTTLDDYPSVDPEKTDSRLVVRDRAAFPGGTELPKNQWNLKGNKIHLSGGFEPGKTYELFYLSEAPPVAGLGYAAIRDAVSWLKHDSSSLAPVKQTYAFGSSQCGRFLRDFLYLGFNTDEQDQQVFEGVFSHVAGAGRLVLNQRWSTPRAVAGYYTSSYPFSDAAQVDPVSGHVEGILENPRVKHIPKIFYINMSAEYWGAGRVAALTHLDPAGKKDIPFPENVRSYFFSGTSHGPAPFPPDRLVKGAPLANPVNPRASFVALRQALHLWVTENVEPPESVYPKLSEGTLIPVSEIQFPKIPGISAPNAVTAGGRVRNPQWADGAGELAELPLLVPQIDEDGNELGGIRMPDVAVPLGTATGWVFRPEELGSPHEIYLLRGSWLPFARTKAERESTGDPRISLEERYKSKQDYLDQVKLVLEDLINQRLMFKTDLEPQLQQASKRWDWVMKLETR